MKSIASNILEIKRQLPPALGLVAVSKLQPAEAIQEAYAAGQRVFGESRVQDLLVKQPQLPEDIAWHFIGHVQTNKLKQLVGKVQLIHSVDSERLLWAIEEEAQKKGVLQDCLLELHVAMEETKSGFSMEEVLALVRQAAFSKLHAVRICGVMGMASFTEDRQQVRTEFHQLKQCYDALAQSAFAGKPEFKHLSMGMSGDWPIAVEEGSTLIRIGSQIFGSRG